MQPVPQSFDYLVLRGWQAESDMRLEEVAYRAECSFTHLRRLLAGTHNPSADLLARLAAVYGRDVRELFTDPAGAR